MLLDFFKPANKTPLDTERDIAADITEDEFIPYACHFNPHTLLTKNGELVQILRIRSTAEGLDYEPAEASVTLRDAIRETIGTHIPSDRFSFWFHTLRRRRSISHAPSFGEPFAAALHAAWQQAHRWQSSFSNEIYLSVVHQGQSADLFDMKELAKTLLPKRNRDYREHFLDTAETELSYFTEALASGLGAHYRVERLGLETRATGEKKRTCSTMLEFIHYLLNLSDGEMEMGEMDASKQLATHELTFGFDAMESRDDSNRRRFAAIVSLKGALELTTRVLDRCLQLPEEMVITQSFVFTRKDERITKKIQLRETLEASLENDIAEMTGLTAVAAHDRGQPIDYGYQHTTFLLARDQYKTLDAAIGRLQDACGDIGTVSVREDLRLEECFWGQLPANFAFIGRKFPVISPRLASFMRLNYFPAGKAEGNHWGRAVTILPTFGAAPYFFNFHAGNNGHTAFIDYNGFSDERGATLLNFLLTCTRQYNGRLIVMDNHQSTRPLMKALGGAYYHFGGSGPDLPDMNPFALEDTPRNRAFLTAWLAHFLRHEEHEHEALRESLKAVLDQLYALPAAERRFSTATELLTRSMPGRLTAAASHLQRLFAADADRLDFTQGAVAFEMEPLLAHPESLVPVFSYLLHRIILSLDGTPTVIVLNEAWSLLDNDFFAPRLASLLDMLRQNNAMVIFTTRRMDEHAASYLTETIMRHAATKIFLPDDIPVDYFPEAAGLALHEVRTLLSMDRQRGDFIVHHGGETVHCRFPLTGLEEFAATLAGDARALRLRQIRKG